MRLRAARQRNQEVTACLAHIVMLVMPQPGFVIFEGGTAAVALQHADNLLEAFDAAGYALGSFKDGERCKSLRNEADRELRANLDPQVPIHRIMVYKGKRATDLPRLAGKEQIRLAE